MQPAAVEPDADDPRCHAAVDRRREERASRSPIPDRARPGATTVEAEVPRDGPVVDGPRRRPELVARRRRQRGRVGRVERRQVEPAVRRRVHPGADAAATIHARPVDD